MKTVNPITTLIATAMMEAARHQLQAAAAATTSEPASAEPAPKVEVTATGIDSLLDQLFGQVCAAPEPSHGPAPIAQVCTIHQDIAGRVGMNEPDFDPNTLAGKTTALLAAALSNLRELSAAEVTPQGKAKYLMADQNIGAAAAALQLA